MLSFWDSICLFPSNVVRGERDSHLGAERGLPVRYRDGNAASFLETNFPPIWEFFTLTPKKEDRQFTPSG